MADELYAKRIPVVFKSTDREDRRASVSIKMEMATVTSPTTRKELVVRLTDDKDLFFLYTLRLGEEDFQSLKMQQGLLVDFGAFPQKFIDLLEMCLKEEHKDIPKFVLHIISQGSYSGDRSTATLNIVETNPFKHLNHLSLKFVPGSDADVKKYLADCLKQFKETNSLLQQRLEHTDTDLNHRLKNTQELLNAKTIELDNLKAEWTAKLNDQIARHKQEIALEKERTYQLQSSSQQRQEQERREMEQSHNKMVQQLESRLYDIETVNKDLTERRYKNEATIRDLKSKLSTLEEENTHLKQDVQSLRKQNSSLDADYHEQEKIINQLRMRVAVLEQEIKDKEQVLTKSSDLLGAEQDKKRRFEDDIESQKKEINKLTNKMKAMSEELMKGNEIIKKLQGEIKNYHGKIKLRTQIATEQEKLLNEKETELEKIRHELATSKNDQNQKTEQNKTLKENYETTVQKLEECRELLKTNENVIQWLNKQINETQLQHHRAGTFEMPGSAGSFRPSGAALHNYSTSSYGSTQMSSHTHPGGDRGMGVGVPRPYPNQHKGPQVQYNPGNPKRSGLPIPHSLRNGAPPIPEEIRPTSRHSSPGSNHSNHSAGDKENDPPLDPKYLTKREDAIPLRGVSSTRSASPPVIHSGLGSHISSRLSQQQVVVPKAMHSQPPPLASAYFPGQKGS
ncbi:spindle assembly abnormal protein 6 homolog [Mercenaria mercenaria]|uniref:spindle assembly abnormal protein 6 homolog n=1 Tax=Mercenaria mercenaria TaxID=6596 RepID=UPI00234F813E|nr:spindle assembly abnormal protein 6 homolog [Mercenaria mercenaria]